MSNDISKNSKLHHLNIPHQPVSRPKYVNCGKLLVLFKVCYSLNNGPYMSNLHSSTTRLMVRAMLFHWCNGLTIIYTQESNETC